MIEILTECTGSSAQCQLWADLARQMNARFGMSLKGSKICREEAEWVAVEVAEVELVPWRRFLDVQIKSR